MSSHWFPAPNASCLVKKTHGIPEPGHPQRVCVQKTVYRGQGPSGREFLEKEMVVVRQNDGATSGDLWNAPLPPPHHCPLGGLWVS